MRAFRFALVGAVLVLVSVSALRGVAATGDNLWQTDARTAAAQARAQKKPLLVAFMGTDWCRWCIKLKQEVFDQKAFQEAAPKRYVLVLLDFPRNTKLPDQLKMQNEGLANKYGVRGFPTVLLLNAAGEVMARTGYRPGSPAEYVAHLAQLEDVYQVAAKARTKLASTRGLPRARLLDQLIEACTELGTGEGDVESWAKEIISLDAQNRAGLKPKYQVRVALAEADRLRQTNKAEDAHATLDKALMLPKLKQDDLQELQFQKARIYAAQQNYPKSLDWLKKALATAPAGPKVAAIQDAVKLCESEIEKNPAEKKPSEKKPAEKKTKKSTAI
jgi:thioredoxin-related protein